MNSDRIQLLQEINAAIDAAPIRRRKKRRLKRALRRPAVQQYVLDKVTAQAVEAGYITIQDEDGDRPPIDWEGIQDFLNFLIGWITQLIGIFQ